MFKSFISLHILSEISVDVTYLPFAICVIILVKFLDETKRKP